MASMSIGCPWDGLLQALALELFHHNERMAVMVFDLVDGADIGMVQKGSGLGLALEAFERFGIVDQAFQE